jgi:hypothetical protein
MIVFSPTPEQYNKLNKYKFNSSELIFVKDGSNKFIVGVEVLQDVNFNKIYHLLNELEKIDYTENICLD